MTYHVYRGDDTLFEHFDDRKIGTGLTGGRGIGFWFSNCADAAAYFGEHVRPFTLIVSEPKVYTWDEIVANYPHGTCRLAVDAFINEHDCCVIPDYQDGDRVSTVYCVLDKELIQHGHYARQLPSHRGRRSRAGTVAGACTCKVCQALQVKQSKIRQRPAYSF